jgi:hypothetical protein
MRKANDSEKGPQAWSLVESVPAGLIALRLSASELQALSYQGFVACERRGRTASVYKLRFRINGRQCVRYVGTDPQRAAVIRAALDRLQAPLQLKRQLASHLKAAQACLRNVKPRLTPHAEEAGLRFHGHYLRRPRQPCE